MMILIYWKANQTCTKVVCESADVTPEGVAWFSRGDSGFIKFEDDKCISFEQ